MTTTVAARVLRDALKRIDSANRSLQTAARDAFNLHRHPHPDAASREMRRDLLDAETQVAIARNGIEVILARGGLGRGRKPRRGARTREK